MRGFVGQLVYSRRTDTYAFGGAVRRNFTITLGAGRPGQLLSGQGPGRVGAQTSGRHHPAQTWHLHERSKGKLRQWLLSTT